MEPKNEEFKIGGGSGYGYSKFTVGDVIRNPKITEKNPHKYLTVLSANSRYYKYDGLSFGVGDDSGYVFSATVRQATDAEAANLIREDEAREGKRLRKNELSSIKKQIKTSGDRPAGVTLPDGRIYESTQDIYGGGDWFVVGTDYIWYVENNGGNGDDWSQNNIRTAGAGAIGWRIPFKQETADIITKSSITELK